MILVGQHCMPTVGEFAFGPDAHYIRIDRRTRTSAGTFRSISASSAASWPRSKRWPTRCRDSTHDAWVAEIAAARKRFEEQNAEYYKVGSSYTDAVHPAVIAKELADFLYRGCVAEGTDDDRVGRLRHRALRAARASRASAPARS